MEMTPFKLEMILHYHYSPHEYPKESEARDDVHEEFIEIGLLDYKKDKDGLERYFPNREMISVYVEKLLTIPLPTLKYIIEE